MTNVSSLYIGTVYIMVDDKLIAKDLSLNSKLIHSIQWSTKLGAMYNKVDFSILIIFYPVNFFFKIYFS